MKEKTKSSPVLMRIRENLKAEKRLFLALLIMYMISLPLYTIVEELCYKIRKMYDYNEQFYEHKFIFTIESFLEFSPVIIFVAVLEGIVVAMSVFKYLSKRTEVDKVFSLPLSGAQRFKADFISGLIIYIVPYIISFVIAIVAGTIVDSNLGTSIITYEGELSHGIVLWIYLFFIKLMFYAFCVFACVCCGNAVQTVVGIVVLNIVVPICSYVPIWVIGQEVPGYHPYEMYGLLECTSPVGAIFAMEMEIRRKSEYMVISEIFGINNYEFITWMLSYILVIIAIVLISAWLYKKRKAEDTGKPFAFSLFFYILSGMAIIAIISYFCFKKFYIVGIVLSIMAFIILEFIKNKGFMEIRKFLLSMVYCVSVIGVMFAFIIVGKSTSMFGIMKKIPEISDVKAISMGVYMMGTAKEVVFEEEESKNLILGFNSEVVDYCYLDNDENYSALVYGDEMENFTSVNNKGDITVSFVYVDNKGHITNRMYYIRNDMMNKFLCKLADVNEYRNAVCRSFDERIDKSKENKNGIVLEIFDDLRKSSSIVNFELNDEIAEKLKEGFYTDIMSASADDFVYNYDWQYRLECFNIPSSFSNTVSVLQEYTIK